MGPTWFFEGLAIVCAGQFRANHQPLLSTEDLEKQVGPGRTPIASYPVYGHIVRSVSAKFGMSVLVNGASEVDFPELLWSL